MRRFLALFAMVWLVLAAPIAAADSKPKLAPGDVMRGWYGLMLELVRHWPTFSPPVASRSLTGQLDALPP